MTGLAVAPLLLEHDDAAPHTGGRPDATNARNRCFQVLLDPIPVKPLDFPAPGMTGGIGGERSMFQNTKSGWNGFALIAR